MATQIGPKIGIEGEKEYRQQLSQIIQQTKNLDAEMNKTASAFNENTSQMTKNNAAAKNLTQKIGLMESKLELLNGMLQKSAQKYGENDTKTQAWKRSVDNATASLNMMRQQLDSMHGAEGFSELSLKMADFGTKMQNMGSTLMSVGQKLTTTITLPIVAAGTAAIKFASDTEEAANKVDTVFGTMSEQVREFASTALNSYGLAEGSALQMAGTFGAMATSMGLSQQQAANMSMSLTALAADMASFYNVSTDVAQTSLQGVFTGETEALKKFGIVMTQTNLEEFAAKQGKVYSKMSEGEKVMTRYAYVMQATQDAQGDFARTSDGTANSFRVLKESLKQLAAAFGAELLPIITPVVQTLTRAVQVFANLPAPIKAFITALLLVVAAIGPVITIIGTLLFSLGSIIQYAPAVATAFGLIGASGTVAGAGMMAAVGPALAIVAALAAGAAIGVLIAQNWDAISEAASEMGESIKNAYNRIMGINNELKKSFNGFVKDIIDTFRELPSKVIQAIKQAVDGVKQAFSQMINNAKKSGKDFVEGFVDGIRSKVQKIINEVKKIADTIEQYLGFSCPDKGALSKYESWMPDFMQGLAKGINQNKGVVTKAINSLTKSMVLPLDTNASMNMALAGAGASSSYVGGTTMNVYVDHISELNDLIRIQNQAQQRYRMGAN